MLSDDETFSLLVFLNWTQSEANAGFKAAIDTYVESVAGPSTDLASAARARASELFAGVQS